MKTVYKYPFPVSDKVSFFAPMGPVLMVAMQGDQPCLWIDIFTEHEKVLRTFHVFGTGHEIPDSPALKHVGSFQQDVFVWHVYEDTEAWRS